MIEQVNATIENSLSRVREKIGRAEAAAGLKPGSVTLVGVTKNRTVEEIESALRAGLADIGENRLQEAAEKFPRLKLPATRHFIGHLQRNKARDVLALFDLVQSVDSERLARALDERAGQAGKPVRILMQVNTSAEASKSGVEPDRAGDLYEYIAGCRNLELRGLMTIGPLTQDIQAVAASFRLLRGLFEKLSRLQTPNCRMELLSMGMSQDFEIAVAEGANLVRVGTAIFGPRP